MSSDDAATLARFRESLGARYSFVSDPKGDLIRLYGVKTLFFTFAKRWTFVIDEAQRIRQVHTGAEALRATSAVESACRLPPPEKTIKSIGP